MNENENCPECNSPNIIDDNENGEAVCQNCGLVLDHQTFTPPQDRIPKTTPTNPIAYTSCAIGTEIPSNKRTERNTAYDINLAIQKLELTHNMEQQAIIYMRKLRHTMQQQQQQQQNTQKIRLTRKELTAVSIWAIIKRENYPLSADTYIKKLEPLIKIQNLMKIEKRANQFIKNQNRTTNITLVTKHINKISAQLENHFHLDNNYTHKLSSYAIQIIHANPGIATNRKANIVAASAILAADRLLINRLRLNPLAKIANTGTSSLSAITETCKQHAPPLPKEYAAIKFNHYIFKELKLC